jgi:hypothetical protein
MDIQKAEVMKMNKVCVLFSTCGRTVALLNEAREYLEGMIGRFCRYYSLPLPRRYKRQARKAYPGIRQMQEAYGKEGVGSNP